MKCPNCSFESPDSARFCQQCGHSLARVCPNCGVTASPTAKFCHDCGTRLADPSPSVSPSAPAPVSPPTLTSPPADRLGNLRRTAPDALQQKIRATGPPIEGERKQVTLLFTDVVGSTALAEKLDPEEWGEIVSGAHRCVSDAIYRYEGTIAQLLGDGVLAFFGAPITHEDDPVRAVAAALDSLSAIETYARDLAARRRIENFQMRVGLHTGLVVVGNVGSDQHVEYLAVGDSVNLAARLQSAAEPNTILISASTARLVRHAFELESRGPLELKGKSEPVEAIRVIARKATPESARGLVGLHSQLVGRDRELATLRACVEDLAKGRGQIVSVVGDAGLGKSRLVAELREWTLSSHLTANAPSETRGSADSIVGGEPIRWVEGRSLSYEMSTPYAAFAYLFGHLFSLDANPGLTDAEKYATVRAQVAKIVPVERVGLVAPFLATLLRIDLDGEDLDLVRFLDPPLLRARVFAAVGEIIEGLAAVSPLALVFEDLHWADPTSLELLEWMLSLTERPPLMIVALFRPQRQEPSWHFHETAAREYPHRYTSIALEPLDDDCSRTLVANLLHIEGLPEKVRHLILTKAEGNPFFVEEVIRSLLDAGLVVRDNDYWRATRDIDNIAVPDTLAGVIGARLDRLDGESKQVAQTASVIGREFQFDHLATVHDTSSGLEAALIDLQRRELVREVGRLPDLAYLFKHALTQETVYASLLLSRRRELHRRVAECFERLAPDRANDIARHFLEAHEEARALPYLVEAGSRAARAYATPEAIDFFSRAIDVLQRVEDLSMARRAYEGLGSALALVNDNQRAMENYHAMLHYAEARDDVPMQVSALNKLASAAIWLGRFEQVEHHLVESERLARAHMDRAGLAELYWVRCGICTMTADFGGAVRYLGESVQIGRELNIPEQMAFGLTHMANTLVFMTQFDEAWRTAQEAMRISQDLGDLQHQAELLAFPIPMYHLRSGDLNSSSQAAETGASIAVRIGTAYAEMMGTWVLGSVAQMRGEYERALASFERSWRAGKMMGLLFCEVMPLAAIGATYLEIGEAMAERADEYYSRALMLMENPAGAVAGGTAWADIGFGALVRGDLDRAEEMFRKALMVPTTAGQINRPAILIGAAMVELARGQVDEAARFVGDAHEFAEARGMVHFRPLIVLGEARLSAAQGETERAFQQFARAESLAQNMGLRPLVWQSRSEAAKLLTRLGRAHEAAEKRSAAHAVVADIAETFADERLRATFLASAQAKFDAEA